MARRYYSSTAARTTLATGVDDTTTTLSVTAVSGWPTSFPYTLVIDQDTVNEELVEVSARSGTTLTVTRGVDGTSAVAHSAGAAVNHGVSARDFDEPNAFINGTGTVTETLLATGAVTSTKILDGTIMDGDINASAAIAQSKIANLTSDLASKVDYATPTNAQSGTAYTFVGDDAFRLTTSNSASAVTFTIPAASAVAWEDDTILRVVNYGAGALTVAGGSGVTVTNTATTIGQYFAGAAIRTGSDAWTLVPFGQPEPFEATGGNEVSTVGGYKYHLFTSSSTFVVDSGSGPVEIAVIGAGGGGGRGYAGGGGGGGAKEPASGYTTQTLSAGSYTVTIASGGAGSTSNSVKGGTPSATSFAGTSTISANGGGGGGSSTTKPGDNGGSGGGGFGESSGNAGGSASGSNTNAGGNGVLISGKYGAGGGGGATAAGQTTANGNGGNGGAGLTLTTIDSNLTSGNFTTFSGMTVVSSGGGGGNEASSAGTGGTGAGNGATAAGNGTSATSFGSGGGGGGGLGVNAGNGGNGYAGLVIVRYAV